MKKKQILPESHKRGKKPTVTQKCDVKRKREYDITVYSYIKAQSLETEIVQPRITSLEQFRAMYQENPNS